MGVLKRGGELTKGGAQLHLNRGGNIGISLVVFEVLSQVCDAHTGPVVYRRVRVVVPTFTQRGVTDPLFMNQWSLCCGSFFALQFYYTAKRARREEPSVTASNDCGPDVFRQVTCQ